MSYVPPPPNPYLPDATGVAPGNGHDFRPQGIAQQAAVTAAWYAAQRAAPAIKEHGPRLLKQALRSLAKM